MVDDTPGVHSPLAQPKEGVVLLRIAKSSLPGDQNSPLSPDHICVLKAKISEISPFSGNTAKWLMKISKLIFDPLGRGQLFTHPMQPMDDSSDPLSPKWVKVQETDPIEPQIYEYRSDTSLILRQISFREDDSRTSKPCRKAQELAHSYDKLIERDRVCVISGIDGKNVLAVSRLIPEHMGDSFKLGIGKQYIGNENVGSFDPSVAILLNGFLKVWVESYLVGMHHIEGDSYAVHNFYKDDLCVFGYHFPSLPPLHGHLVTLCTHDSGISLPPPDIFDWHYLQCVLARFSTDEYKALGGDDDNDDEWSNNDDGEPPYPSYCFERYVSRLAEEQRIVETNEAIAQWNASVHDL